MKWIWAIAVFLTAVLTTPVYADEGEVYPSTDGATYYRSYEEWKAWNQQEMLELEKTGQVERHDVPESGVRVIHTPRRSGGGKRPDGWRNRRFKN